MPFIDINDARLYYETFGEDRPGRCPIVLIHGSTGTGRSNWSLVAPILAREWRVIVPDCRGHGQSSNPHKSYSFKEMAADTSGLIRALGYRRAHLIGHSNGGNVALVTLLEHPEVAQTCIAQAANAYVSSDLVEKEPAIFDPDRVAREAPGWMNEMIALHGATHGPDYWRDLLRLTVQEIITEPNYTPADLAQVNRPVLVIQGANDRVNAPARHAQFIAQHIPDAELWIPKDVGHNVHEERLFDWVSRVLDFLARRGDDANAALYRLRRARYADGRETIFDVQASLDIVGEIGAQSARRGSVTPDSEPPGRRPGGSNKGIDRDGDRVVLEGQVLTVDQRETALNVLPVKPAEDRLRVLLTDETPHALVNRSVADVRREPRGQSELMTEALAGESARILEERDGWARVRLDRDGYLGWMRAGSLLRCGPAEVEAYHAAKSAIVIAELAQTYASPLLPGEPRKREASHGPEMRSGKLPFGVALPIAERRDGFAAVRLPDGRLGWIADGDLLPAADRPGPDAPDMALALSLLRRCVGVPYLWGGRTPFGFDCSGFAQTLWSFVGVPIPRDADQQFRAGLPVEGTPRPGDLLYFGEAPPLSPPQGGGDERGGITHVAISLGGDELIHSNGTDWCVAYNSLDPASPIYRAWLKEHLAGVRRFADR